MVRGKSSGLSGPVKSRIPDARTTSVGRATPVPALSKLPPQAKAYGVRGTGPVTTPITGEMPGGARRIKGSPAPTASVQPVGGPVVAPSKGGISVPGGLATKGVRNLPKSKPTFTKGRGR